MIGNRKNILYIGIGLVIVLVVLIILTTNNITNNANNAITTKKVNFEVDQDGSKRNVNTAITNGTFKVQTYTIKNCNLVYKDGQTTFNAMITNNEKAISNLKLRVTFFVSNTATRLDKEISVGSLKANETKEITASFTEDLTNIYNITFSVVK